MFNSFKYKGVIMKSVFTTLSIIFFSFYAQAWIFSPAEVSGSIDLNSSSSLTISNNSGISQSMNLSVSHPALSISLNRCTGNLLNNRTCSVSFAINVSLMPVGETIVALNNNGNPITNLKYVKNAPLEVSQFDQSSAILSDFSQQSVYITNKTLSSKSYSPSFSGTDASKFSIVLNRCTNVGVNKSCQIVYRLMPPQASGSYSASLIESQVQGSLSINASISSSVPGVLPPVVSSLSVSSSSLNFGTLTQYGLSYSQNVVITNTGNSSLTPIIEVSSNAGLALNRCSTLSAGQSCSISIGMKPSSSTPNGAMNESVIVKKNSGDSGLSIALSANLNVVAGCPANQHLESGSCVSNIRSCSISNGSGTQTWSAGVWGSCNVSSCNSGYYQLSNSCSLITYSATYSSYSPDPSSIQVCGGSVISTRSIISCMRNDNFQIVSNSNCIDLASSISTQSPAGNINVSILNGSETRSCALGSSIQTLVSRTCDSGYFNNGSSCQPISYIATYSSYSPTIPSSMNVCDGTIISSRYIEDCRQAHDNQSVPSFYCSDSNPSIISQSPAGNINISISNGSETRSCALGSSTQNLVSRTCDAGHYDDGSGCSLISYVPTFSDYSPQIQPLNTCDGTVISNRSILDCKQAHDNQSVSTAFCSDPTPSVTTQSPAGNLNISISNGSETYYCDAGSTNQVFLSRSCLAEYFDNGSSCQQIVYIPTYSSYSPAIPSSLNACDGTVSSTRSIINCVQQHNGLSVGAEKCPIDSNSTVITQSPAGNINVSISNGSEIRSCALGSSSQSFVSRTCDSGYYNNGSSCQLITYIATYSSYSPAIPSSMNVCDGTVTSTRSISNCRQSHDNLSVANSFCSDPSPSVISQSPAGNINVSISNGSETRSCALGSSSQSFVSRSCNSGYYDNGSSCQLITYIATYSSYSPAIPSSMNVCDGTVISTRTITNCRQSHDNLSVSTTLCSDSSPSVTSQSPAGNLNVSISNGSETRSCALGSSTQTLVSRTCNSGYVDNGSICDPAIQFVDLGLNNNGVLKNNNAYLWGTDGWGALGNGTTTGSATPVQPSTSGVLSGKTLTAITLGNKVLNRNFMCAIASDGLPYCWGAGTAGGLGNGGTANSSVPVAVTTSGVLSGKTILKIANSAQSACVIASDNKVYCWGRNNEGELGTGSTTPTSSSVPVAITSGSTLATKNAVSIYMSGSGSTSYAYVLTSDGQLFSWGDNTNGQLCRGGSFSATPTAINLSGLLAGRTITNVVLAGNSTYIQTSDGKAFACGANSLGQLGIGTSSTSVTSPTEISTANFPGKTIKKISSAGTFGCLINSDDLPFCWGQNLSGKTGLNLTSGNTLSPTAVVLTGDMASKTYIDIETNGSASYFLSNDKKLYSTGGGFGGVLGNGGTTDVAVPGPIAGTLNTLLVNKIYAGNNQACAVTSLNQLYCWGSGNQNGTSSGSVATPALVNIP